MTLTSLRSSNFHQMRFDGESPNPTKRARTPAPQADIPIHKMTVHPPTTTPSGSGGTSPAPQIVADPKTGQRVSMRQSLMKCRRSSDAAAAKLSVNSAERPSLNKAPPSPRMPEQFLRTCADDEPVEPRAQHKPVEERVERRPAQL